MPHKDPGPAADRLFGAQEAARFLGVHRSTLHMAVRQGVIMPDAHTPGGHMRFSRETLEAFRGQLVEGVATAGSVYAPVHALADLARLLAECAEFERICAAAVASLRAALPGVDMCAIAVRAGDPRDPVRLRVVAQQGFPAWLFQDYARLRTIFKFATTTVLLSGEMEVCEDVSQQPVPAGTARIRQPLRLGGYAVVPIGGGGRAALGVIVCSCHRPRVFSEHDRAFLRAVADQVAVALTTSAQHERASANLDAACELIALALALSGNAQDEGEPVTASEEAHALLRDAFLRLSGAARVCALGFGAQADLGTADPHLLDLACTACAGDEPVREQWRESGVLHTGIGASVAVGDQGRRAGVAAVWRGERLCPGVEQALLVAFAGACVLALG